MKKINFIILILSIYSCFQEKRKSEIKQIRIWERMEYNQDSILSYNDTIFNNEQNRMNRQEAFLDSLVQKNRDSLYKVLAIDKNGINIENIIVVSYKGKTVDSVLKIFLYIDSSYRKDMATIFYYSTKYGVYAKLYGRNLDFLYKTIREEEKLSKTFLLEKYIKELLIIIPAEKVTQIHLDNEVGNSVPKEWW